MKRRPIQPGEVGFAESVSDVFNFGRARPNRDFPIQCSGLPAVGQNHLFKPQFAFNYLNTERSAIERNRAEAGGR
jgi:hypothetical protein